jgi:glyoxylase I family protein
MNLLRGIHHIAIICSDYNRSKKFYTEVLGFKIVNEYYREERQSYKLDLSLNDIYTIELFSFPSPPLRASGPEATGLRHIAFKVGNLAAAVHYFQEQHIEVEPVRMDEFTQKQFTFLRDPDNLPIELYEE